MDAIQACGGQKTADGKRYRTGGGILWGILKLRDPNAYKEIMKKGNEFEVSHILACSLKQFSFSFYHVKVPRPHIILNL